MHCSHLISLNIYYVWEKDCYRTIDHVDVMFNAMACEYGDLGTNIPPVKLDIVFQ